MKTIILKALLTWLLSVSREQVETVILWALEAAGRFTEGKVKNAWVRENIAKVYPMLKPHVVDCLVGFAVGLLKKGAVK